MRGERDGGGFQRAYYSDALLAQPRGCIPYPGIQIAFRDVQRDQGVELVSTVDCREWLIRRAVECGPQASGNWLAICGDDAQVETLGQFFPGGIAEGRGGLGGTGGCCAGYVTFDCGGRTAFGYQGELCLHIGCGLSFAEEQA